MVRRSRVPREGTGSKGARVGGTREQLFTNQFRSDSVVSQLGWLCSSDGYGETSPHRGAERAPLRSL